MIEWHHDRMAEDRISFPNAPLSLDVEQVQCTLLDVLQLAGVEHHEGSTVKLNMRLGDMFYGKHKDQFVELLVHYMWGNRLSWAFMLTILAGPVKQAGHGGKMTHTIRKFTVQRYVLALLECLPHVVGFGIK